MCIGVTVRRMLLSFHGVDRPPLRALVDHLVVEDEPALLADHLAPLVVHGEVGAVALRTPSDFFGLFDLLGRHRFPRLRRLRTREWTGRPWRRGGRRRTAPSPGRT